MHQAGYSILRQVETDVDGGRRLSNGADGDIIDAGFGNTADGFEVNPA